MCWKRFLAIIFLSLLLAASCRQLKEVESNVEVDENTDKLVEFDVLGQDEFYVGPYDIDPYFGYIPSTDDGVMPAKVPEIPGMQYVSSESIHFGLRCPNREMALKLVSTRAKKFADWCNTSVIDTVTISLSLLEEVHSTKDILNYYIAPLLSYESSYIDEDSTSIEQFGTIIADIWCNEDYTTFQEVCWYDANSCGDNTERSWFTVDNKNGEVLAIQDILIDGKRLDFAKKLASHLVGAGGPWLKSHDRVYESQLLHLLDVASGCALIEDGVIIFYHPYVIGAGGEGQFNAVVPFSELEGLMKF